MKSKIFMYLFFFSALLILFMYMNQKVIFEDQEKSITSLKDSLLKRNDSIVMLTEQNAELNYFTLQGNENAMTYLERLGMNMEVSEIENMISESIYEKNLETGGNPLVQLDGYGEFRINKLKFINHRWIQADFSDGKVWGEVLLDYFFDEKNNLLLTPISTVLYPN